MSLNFYIIYNQYMSITRTIQHTYKEGRLQYICVREQSTCVCLNAAMHLYSPCL